MSKTFIAVLDLTVTDVWQWSVYNITQMWDGL